MTTKHRSPDEDITTSANLADTTLGLTLLTQFLRQDEGLLAHSDLTDYTQSLALMPFFIAVAKGAHPKQHQLQNKLNCNDIQLKKAAMRAIKAIYLDHIDDPCRVLGLNPWASLEEGQHRYRQLIRLFHPDRNVLEDEAIADRMTANLNLAYQQFTAHEAKRQPVPSNKKRTAHPTRTSSPTAAQRKQAAASARKHGSVSGAAARPSRQTTANAASAVAKALQTKTSGVAHAALGLITAGWWSATRLLIAVNHANTLLVGALQTACKKYLIGLKSLMTTGYQSLQRPIRQSLTPSNHQVLTHWRSFGLVLTLAIVTYVMFAIWHSIKEPNDAGLFEERASLLATQQVQQVKKVQQAQQAQQAQPLVPDSLNADTDNSAVVTEQAPILTASATPDDLTHVAELEPAPVIMPNKPLPSATASPIQYNDSKQILASHNDNASQKPQQQASKQPGTSSDSVTKRPQPITLAAQTTQSNTSNDIKPLKQVLPAKPAQTEGLAKQSSLPDAPLNANPSVSIALKLTASLDQAIASQPPAVHANALAPVEPAMAVPLAKTAPTQTNLNNQPDQAPRQIQAPPVSKQALELALAGFITAIADGNLGHIDDLLMDAVNTDNARGKQRLVQMFSHMFETSAERDFSLLGLQWASRDDRMIATTRYQLQLRHIGTAEYAAYQGRLTLEWVHQAGQVKLAGFYHGQDPLFQ
jgi:hypothetical protein